MLIPYTVGLIRCNWLFKYWKYARKLVLQGNEARTELHNAHASTQRLKSQDCCPISQHPKNRCPSSQDTCAWYIQRIQWQIATPSSRYTYYSYSYSYSYSYGHIALLQRSAIYIYYNTRNHLEEVFIYSYNCRKCLCPVGFCPLSFCPLSFCPVGFVQ